jgi:AcrR family transcriptional regulator
MDGGAARQELLGRVVQYAAGNGIGGKSLREIAQGIGSSHRMLLYHFGTHEGLMAAVVEAVEQRQREVMTEFAAASAGPRELSAALWQHLSSPQLRPFVRLFFEVFGLAAQGAAGTDRLLRGLTDPWLAAGQSTALSLGADVPPAAVRLGVAVTRGLLLDLVAGADPAEVDAAFELFQLFLASFEQLGQAPPEPNL